MALTLKGEEQALLREEVAAFAGAVSDQETRTVYQALLSALEVGELSDEALLPLGELLEVGLQTGRVRKLHRASGEQALLHVFQKTPAGERRAAALAELNAALAQLDGQTIESVRALARGPGSYLLQISTDRCELTLRFTPDEAGVESVAVGV